jgi:hypothetical protein
VKIQKRKIINYLIVTAVILLMLNIIIELVVKPKKEKPVSELSKSQIEKVFFSVLDNYGIEKSWIINKKHKPADDDSVKTEYEIKLPHDIPIPVLIKDVNKIIQKDITGLVSEEKKINGKTEIRIYTNEILKLKAVMLPDTSVKRNRCELAFIINDAFDLGSKNFNGFLSMRFPLTCTVVPSFKAIDKADSLKQYLKEYVILLNDDLSESKMKLAPDFQKEMLRASINTINSSFGGASGYIVDEKSVLFRSSIYGFVRDEFKKMKISLIPMAEFIILNPDNENELHSRFRIYCEDASKTKIFYITYNNFLKILPDLESYYKKGNQVTALSKTYLNKREEKIKKD